MSKEKTVSFKPTLGSTGIHCPICNKEFEIGDTVNQGVLDVTKEAATVHNDTGYSPRQLAEQKQALLSVCEAILRIEPLWLPCGEPKEHQIGEYEALHSMKSKLTEVVKAATA